jgi:hypothetical protein
MNEVQMFFVGINFPYQFVSLIDLGNSLCLKVRSHNFVKSASKKQVNQRGDPPNNQIYVDVTLNIGKQGP